MYVEGNPVNRRDPSGLCPNCFVFFFTGAGSAGDIDGDNDLFNNLTSGQQTMLGTLSPYATVKLIYPYGNGVRISTKIEEAINDFYLKHPGSKALPIYNALRKVLPSFYGWNSLGTSKANQTWEELLGICPSQDVTIDNSQVKITFIGYSGGTQIAYSAAQELSSKLFVDNLVQIAPTYGAYNQMANIGSLWELVGEDDNIVGYADSFWHDYNSGWIREPVPGGAWGFMRDYVHDSSLDIYQNGATRCTMLNADNVPYIHAGDGDYFDFGTPTGGTICGGTQVSNITTASRGQAIVDMLINVIGIGR
jgi:hypothetical protein